MLNSLDPVPSSFNFSIRGRTFLESVSNFNYPRDFTSFSSPRRPCNCNPSGSTNLQCDLQLGNCSCKRDTQGLKCDTCKAGFYALQSTNVNGCKSCFCFNKSSECGVAGGFYVTSIQSQFLNTTDQWLLVNSSSMAALYYNTSSGIRFDAFDDFVVSFRAPSKFLGNKLSSYAQTLSIQFTSTIVPPNSAVRLILSITHTDRSIASFQLSANLSLRQQTVAFRLQEAYTIEGITANRLQHTLTSVADMTIQFNTSSVTGITVQRIQLMSASNSIVSSQAANYVENCSCPISSTGNSCESCAPGWFKFFM